MREYLKDMRLQDRTAVITGAGRGIGKAIASRFAEEGARVALIDIDLSYAENVAETLRSRGLEAQGFKADVSVISEIERVFEQVVRQFHRLDILVNSAGTRKDVPFYKLSGEEWDAVINTQLKGTFNCCRAAQKHMVQRNSGRIINLSSPFPPAAGEAGQTGYITATAGVGGFTRALAVELGPYGINVNCIAPDYIDTEMTRDAARREGMYLADFKKLALSRIPLRRIGTPGDVAGVALVLASDDSSFISGQTIYIKGGP